MKFLGNRIPFTIEQDTVKRFVWFCDENTHILACDQKMPLESFLGHLAYLYILLCEILFLRAMPHLPIVTPGNAELTSSLLVSWFPKRESVETIAGVFLAHLR